MTSNQLVESDVVKVCLDLLRVRGWLPLRLHCGAFKSPDGKSWIQMHPKGTPDFVVTHWHWPAFFLETKRPQGGVLADVQRERQRELLIGYYQQTLVCRDAHTLIEWLDAWERQHGPLPPRRRLSF